jgi:hypothetical protein
MTNKMYARANAMVTLHPRTSKNGQVLMANTLSKIKVNPLAASSIRGKTGGVHGRGTEISKNHCAQE